MAEFLAMLLALLFMALVVFCIFLMGFSIYVVWSARYAIIEYWQNRKSPYI